MIGANDRQQMLVDGVRETVRSEGWNKEYAARAAELAKAISARKVPFLWVGMPPFKSSKTMLDMLAFNDIYRAAAASAGGEYVDIWDGFVDENGAYMSNGPDINGQPARLRANDGINLARPGKRKVAFYAEKPLYKLLGIDPTAPASAATALSTRPAYRIMGPFGPTGQEEPSNVDVVIDPNELGPLDPARPVALRTPALDGGVELLGAVAEPTPRGAHAGRKARHRRHRAGAGDRPRRPIRRAAACLRRDGDAGDEHRPDVEQAGCAVGPARPDRGQGQAARGPFRRSDRTAARSAASRAAGDPAGPAAGDLARAGCARDRLSRSAVGRRRRPSTRRSYLMPRSVIRSTCRRRAARRISPTSGRSRSARSQPARRPQCLSRSWTVPAPAGAEEEIPAASNADGAAEAEAIAGVRRTRPRPRVPRRRPCLASSTIPRPPERAPRKADPVPVAALPATKDAPTELLPAGDAPAAVAAPNAPVETGDRCFGGEGRAVRSCRHHRQRARSQIGSGERRRPPLGATRAAAGLPVEVRPVTPIAPAAPSVLPASPAAACRVRARPRFQKCPPPPKRRGTGKACDAARTCGSYRAARKCRTRRPRLPLGKKPP